jgi:probable F420-dependent oxidoreductase
MKFGLVGFPLGQLYSSVDVPPSDAVTRITRAADEGGFDFVCAQDHIMAPREWAQRSGATWFDPFVVLSWAAAASSRIALVTDVLIAPYRSPFQVAKTMGTLDVMSSGRAICGVAAGYLEAEFAILGAEFHRRGALTDEWIEALKAAWSDEWVEFKGEFFNASDVAIAPRPSRRPPIWIGGNSMRALRRAVEHADGWTPFRCSPDEMKTALARHDLPDGFSTAIPLRHGVYADGDAHLDVDSILRQVDAYRDAGATHIKVGFKGPTLAGYLGALEEFASKVIARG